MKLFGHPDSGHAFKVKLALAVAGIEHEYQLVDIFAPRETRAGEFREHSRFHEVPMLLDDGTAHVQSNAILIHLATKAGVHGAQNTALFARCVEWLFWEANKIGLCLPQLRAANKFTDMRLSDGAKQWLLARYVHDVAIIEAELSDGREFIVGDEPTIADFSLCGYLYFADEAAVKVPSAVQAWLERIASLPGWQHPYDLLKAPQT